MLANYIKTALRTLRRRPGYSMLNITGLSLGMACCLLIALYVQGELSFDRFWSDGDRIYRVALDVNLQDLHTETAFTPRPLGPAIASELPEVEHVTRLWTDPSGKMMVRHGEHVFPEERVFFGDSTFFDVFVLPLLQGNPETALKDPLTVVISESVARKYFGDANPMGKTIHFREPADRDIFDYTVTGVMQDLPSHSHLDFDFLASFSTQRHSRSQNWLAFGVYTYVKLKDHVSTSALQAKLPALFDTYGRAQLIETYGSSLNASGAVANQHRYFLQSVADIHLHSNLEDEVKPTSDIRLVFMFGVIAFFVLVVAGVNFVNLSTALATRRSTEVGVRKTMGSFRSQLIVQFLVEAILLSLLSIGLALALVSYALPYFSEFSGSVVVLDTTSLGLIGPIVLGLGVLVGLGAGVYPAIYLSGFQPASVLKGGHSGRGHRRLRNVLVVFQFGVATLLIACTAIVYSQMNYLLSKNLGYDAEQVVFLEGAEVMGRQAEAFRETLRQIPGVVSVTNSELVPGSEFTGSTFKLLEAPDEQSITMDYTYASYDFVETLGMNVVEGRSLSRDFASDSLAVLLNESAVEQLGLEEPLGKQLVWRGESTYTIVGVLEDFHITSLHREIGPVALLGPDPRNVNRPNLIVSTRIQLADWGEIRPAIEAAWLRFAPQSPFVYSFLDASMAQLYENERRVSRLVTFFALLAVLIACFGLFGLAAFMAEQRTKEIGVRKVMGASEKGIVLFLSKDFIKLVLIAIAISTPIAYLLMTRWLESFAFTVDVGPGIFVLSGLISILIALLAVSYQSIKASKANPVDVLKY